jgi:DNA-binding CsgD family transcriptional regulator
LSHTLSMASVAATWRGDRAVAQRLLDEARAISSALDDLGATLMAYQAEALNALADGDLATVSEAAAEGARLSHDAGDLYSLGMMLMNQGYAALGSGAVRDAETWLTEGLRIAHQIDDRVAQCYLVGALGCCAAADQRPRAAAELLGAMANLCTEIGATVLPSMAPMLTEATRSATAALGAAAFESSYQSGRQLSRDAAVRLALRTPAPTTSTAASHPAGLSRREADVARLVSQGLSNKGIGARLFISERTVESHVRNILTKLGFTSRAQVAGWAAAQHGPA